MSKPVKSWDHVVHLLLPAEVDYADRFGHECATGKCVNPPTHVLTYTYVSGSYGRATRRVQRVCTVHADKFAAKHGVTIGEAQPEPTSALDTAVTATTAVDGDRVHEVQVYLSGSGLWYLEKRRVGLKTGPVRWMAGVDANATLAAVLEEAEMMLADEHLTPAGTWIDVPGRSKVSASVKVVAAHRHDRWLHVQWALWVMRNPAGMWQLQRSLSPRFPPIVTDLGDTRMDLDRAIGVAVDVLAAEGWVTDRFWTSYEDATAENLGWHPDQANPDAWRTPAAATGETT